MHDAHTGSWHRPGNVCGHFLRIPYSIKSIVGALRAVSLRLPYQNQREQHPHYYLIVFEMLLGHSDEIELYHLHKLINQFNIAFKIHQIHSIRLSLTNKVFSAN